MNRVFRLLRPSHQHTAFSATLLLMTAVLLSRVIGYIREAYIAWAFGAGPATDAYVAGFTIPDWLNYLVCRLLLEKKNENVTNVEEKKFVNLCAGRES